MRWWDGGGWTEHVALPEPEPEPEPQVAYLDVARAPRVQRPSDGELHPRGKGEVFAGALRGHVPTPTERLGITREGLASPEGLQLLGAGAVTLLCWWLAIRGFLDPGGAGTGVRVGIAMSVGVLVPTIVRTMRHAQARSAFWWHWCASRGFEPGRATGAGRILPKLLSRSPLLGSTDDRVFEHVARRTLVGREAIVGSMLRVLPRAADDDPAATRSTCRFGVVVMPMPEQAAARWQGASIRGDHGARRPLHLRAMLGALVASNVPDCRAHLAAAPGQDPSMLQRLVDASFERYLADHPMDVDVVGDLLVVTRDGDPFSEDLLDELCRDALVVHELLVAQHEVPRPAQDAVPAAVPQEDEPVIDLTRDGWGDGEAQQYRAA